MVTLLGCARANGSAAEPAPAGAQARALAQDPGGEVVHHEDVIVTCEAVSGGDGTLAVSYAVTNRGQAAIHLFESARMPYVLREGDANLVLLHGVNPPDPNIDYPMIEIPTTRPLEPGATYSARVPLVPLVLRDHYQRQRQPTVLHGPVSLVCRVGWGSTPITPKERMSMAIQALLAWQHLSEAPRITLLFP
jgi:hypothetical protein